MAVAKPKQRRDPGLPWFVVAVAALIILFEVAPLVITMGTSVSTTVYPKFPPTGFTLKWYLAFFRDNQFTGAFWLSIRTALLTMVFALLLAFPAAYAVSRFRFPGKQVIRSLVLSPMIVPSVITAVAILRFYVWIGLGTNTLSLAFGHTIMALPFAFWMVLVGLERVPVAVEEAARSLGASRWLTVLRVTLPLAKPGLIAGGLLAFVASFDQFMVSMMLSGVSQVTLPVQLFLWVRHSSTPMLSAISSLLILFMIAAVYVIGRTVGFQVFLGRKD